VQPLEGEETFEADHRYVWVFTVKTIEPEAGAGWSCYQVGPVLLACERTAAACDARRNKPLDAGEAPRPPCSAYPEPWSFVDSAEQAEWFAKDAATCEKARTGYLTRWDRPSPRQCRPASRTRSGARAYRAPEVGVAERFTLWRFLAGCSRSRSGSSSCSPERWCGWSSITPTPRRFVRRES